MTRRLSLIAFALLSFGATPHLHAQARAFECRPGTTAKAQKGILTRVQDAYRKVSTLSADFEQDSFLAALDDSETSGGKMWFSKPGRMRWHYQSPEEQLFLVRDDTVWLHQVSDRQVIIDTFADILLTDLPVAFLMGIGDLEKDFTLEKVCQGSDGTILHLVPRTQRKGRSSDDGLEGFRLLVNPDSWLPAGASVKSLGGNVTSIVFRNVRTGEPASDDLFSPSFPKGIDVQDRRSRS
jgi:outer membrane lipoprotein carrier protein